MGSILGIALVHTLSSRVSALVRIPDSGSSVCGPGAWLCSENHPSSAPVLHGVPLLSSKPFCSDMPTRGISFNLQSFLILLHTCFVDPISSPLTFVQSILPSNSSSTSPHTTTLSPRTINNPLSSSELGSSSSCERITRSVQFSRARLVTLSQEMRLPTMQRPSTRIKHTFSVGGEGGLAVLLRLGCCELAWAERKSCVEGILTVHVAIEGHDCNLLLF